VIAQKAQAMSTPATFRPGGPADGTREAARESPPRPHPDYGLGVLELGLGNYQTARQMLQRAVSDRSHPAIAMVAPDLIEASVRCGRRRAAAAILEYFTVPARAAGTPLAMGLLSRSRALLASDDLAEDLYLEAIRQLQRSHDAMQLARANLLYGEWLRRRRRRRDAREQLRAAHDVFAAAGSSFAERARAELAATGQNTRRRSVETQNNLTPREQQITRLVAHGATNAETAAKLYISAATVDYHLRSVFRKLGIQSRRQLFHSALTHA
jgi:DNA-binding CsgD family transcriptional regulator